MASFSPHGVLIVEATALVRCGLRRVLVERGLTVVEPVSSLEEATRCMVRTPHRASRRVGLILLGPSTLSAECPQAIEACFCALRVAGSGFKVALMCGAGEGELSQAIRAMKPDCVLGSDVTGEHLAAALELTLLGHTMLPNTWTEKLWQHPAHYESDLVDCAKGVGRLSERERSVVSCLAEGHSNKQIARQLGITEATVKIHVRSLLRKIGARNRTQAALWASRRKRFLQAPSDAAGSVAAPRARDRAADSVMRIQMAAE